MRILQPYACGLALVSSLVACGNGNASSTGSATTSGQQQAVCAQDSRAEVYTVGLSAKAMDGAISVKYVDANPAPPSRELNTWTVDVSDANGKPIEGATIAVKLWMPDHGHGNTVIPSVTDKGGGEYEIGDVLFYMPGIWQVTFTVTPPNGTDDQAVFTFCIDG